MDSISHVSFYYSQLNDSFYWLKLNLLIAVKRPPKAEIKNTKNNNVLENRLFSSAI